MKERLPPLPALAALPALQKALLRPGSSAVFVAPPGSGKTTALPLALLDEPWMGRANSMIILEPRRVAARAAAWRMSDIAGDGIGGIIGYQVRLERKASDATRIMALTEGLLARKILGDPELRGVALLVFDEFHERSLSADFSLALALDARRGLRPDLRILVMSATLDAALVASRLGANAAIVRAEGKMYPVETEFMPFTDEPDIAAKTALGIRSALAARDGGVLAFLPGEGEIRRCAEALENSRSLPSNVDLHALYAALPRREQDAALAPPPPKRRKVVLATSIAESSLTIDGISTVVDSGWARTSRFSPDTGMSHLETIRVSRDRADQRTGRAGRLGPGLCIRLWDEGTDRRLKAAWEPEIISADLCPIVLGCADWGVGEPGALPWPTIPPADAWRSATRTLQALGALDGSRTLTETGRKMAALGVHPRLSRMILESAQFGRAAFDEACTIAAALSENLPASARPSVNIEHLIRDIEEGSGALSGSQRSRIRDLARALCASAIRAVGRPPAPGDAPETGLLLALAYPDRIAKTRPLAKSEGRYLTIDGRGAKVPPGSGIAQSEWIVIADMDDADADGSVRLAAPISDAAVRRLFGDRFSTVPVLAWNDRLQKVESVEKTMLGEIAVRIRPVAEPDEALLAAEMCVGIRRCGIERLGWTRQALRLRDRVAFARQNAPAENFPDVSDEALAANLETWLGPFLGGVRTLEQASKIDLEEALLAYLGRKVAVLDEIAPRTITVPTGSRIAIDYSGAEATAEVRLQECFGMTKTPTVARGLRPVLLRLLSPAMRPVQTTADLSSFWREGYPIVRKELRGRYPRHYWPEDPLSASPTRRAKPRANA